MSLVENHNSTQFDKVDDDKNFNVCSCGYPMISGTEKCPLCGKSKSEHTIEENDGQLELVPYLDKNNRKNIITINDPNSYLSRNDIDPKDKYVSEKEHIKFIKVNNKWFIENTDSGKMVFKRIKELTKIEDGDVILIGKNNFFKININN